MTSRASRGTLVAASFLACAALTASAHAATTMTFDTYVGGTPITNQYMPQGVLFSSVSNSACTIFADAAEATSGANILCGASNFRDIDMKMVDPATGMPSPAWRATHVGLNVISAGWSVVQVSSKDASGTVLESFTVTHPSGPVNGYKNVDHLEFTAGSIASVSMTFTSINFSDGIGWDDVLVDFTGTTPVHPATWGAIKHLYR